MNDIVLELAKEYTKEIMRYFEETGIYDIGEVAKELGAMSNKHAKKLLIAILERIDAEICEAKELRKKDEIVIHERDVSRCVYTSLGEIRLRRTYFKDNESGTMIYLLDHIAGIEAYDRVSSEVAARLVSKCTEMSYCKSADNVVDGEISRQTVKNKAMKTKELAYVPEKKNKVPKELHIFADEDHVHMQSGKSNVLPLITISEGVKSVSKGRNELIEPLHIQGYKIPPENVWEYAYALCDEKYDDIQKVDRIYIHGDGAPWILSGLDVMPNSFHVLDHYHIKAKMRSLTAGSPEGYSSKLWSYLRQGNYDGFSNTIYELLEETEKTYPKELIKKRTKKIRKTGGYMLAHWDAIMRRFEPEMTGSCTEPLVSHVLSERFSRNPMGWSEAGLSKIASCRVYVQNGGMITKDDIITGKITSGKTAPHKIDKYEALVALKTKEFLRKERDWSLFENEHIGLSKMTGTKIALDSLGKTRYVN